MPSEKISLQAGMLGQIKCNHRKKHLVKIQSTKAYHKGGRLKNQYVKKKIKAFNSPHAQCMPNVHYTS